MQPSELLDCLWLRKDRLTRQERDIVASLRWPAFAKFMYLCRASYACAVTGYPYDRYPHTVPQHLYPHYLARLDAAMRQTADDVRAQLTVTIKPDPATVSTAPAAPPLNERLDAARYVKFVRDGKQDGLAQAPLVDVVGKEQPHMLSWLENEQVVNGVEEVVMDEDATVAVEQVDVFGSEQQLGRFMEDAFLPGEGLNMEQRVQQWVRIAREHTRFLVQHRARVMSAVETAELVATFQGFAAAGAPEWL